MIQLLLAIASQALLEKGPAVPLPCKDPSFLAASSTGKYVVLGEAKKVHILDGETLGPLHAIEAEVTAAGFDPRDETLTLVGAEAVRYETKGWKETFRAELPGAQIRHPRAAAGRILVDLRQLEPPGGWVSGQALVGPEGEIYYRSKDGHLSVARESGGKCEAEVLTSQRNPDLPLRVDRVLAVTPGAVVVETGHITGVVLRKGTYTLAASGRPLAVGVSGDTLPAVLAKGFNVYSTKSWKNLSAAASEENAAAVFDPKRACFYVAGESGLRSWDGRAGSAVKELEGPGVLIRGLAVDGAGTRLYGVDLEKLRSWRLKD
jgi:hypothetical protein